MKKYYNLDKIYDAIIDWDDSMTDNTVNNEIEQSNAKVESNTDNTYINYNGRFYRKLPSGYLWPIMGSWY